MTAFLDLGLSEPIARALTDEQYETPTPIQSQTIPEVLAGRDVVGIAQTGTGKTAAFALPILNHLAGHRVRPDKRSCRVLVLSPTRELSAQIVDSFKTYGRYLKPSVALAIGGVNINPQIRALANGVDVLVATPGRQLDLMQQRAVALDRIEVFVLDEADRMLDMGFIHDIRRIVAKLPAKRQTLFFSATMPREIEELAREMLHEPARVAVTPAATTVERALVFTRTKHGADKVVRGLVRDGIPAEAIHGNKSQGQRDRVMAAFRSGRVRILVATDIAARGIDVDGISHVVNYDLPNVPESYVHRIGRTARAGAEGIAISFCDGEEAAYLRDIEKLIRMQIPASGRAPVERPPQQRNGRHQSQRPHGGGPRQGQPRQGQPRQGQPQQQPPRGKGRRQRGRGNAPAAAASAPHDGQLSSMPFMRRHEERSEPSRPQQPHRADV